MSTYVSSAVRCACVACALVIFSSSRAFAQTTQPQPTFLQELVQLMPSAKHWAFGVGSGFIGFMVVIADLVYFNVKGTSLLKLGYAGFWRTILVIALWGLGAGLVGVLGVVFDLFQINPHSSVVVGIAWPVTLPRLLEAASKSAEEDEQT